MAESQLEKLMRVLDLTEDEARQVMEDDKRIDKGEKLFELSEEAKKIEKKMRQADRAPTAFKFQKRERKANEPKRYLIELLAQALADCENVEITNPERQIDFAYGGAKYRIVLSAPRK